MDGQALPTVTTNYYNLPTYPAQVQEVGADGTKTTIYTYYWQDVYDDEDNYEFSYIDHLTGISQTGGAHPYTAKYDDNELLTDYVCGSSSTHFDYGTAVVRTDSFNNHIVRTGTTTYSNGMTQASTAVGGAADVTGQTVLYPGTDGINPWAPALIVGLDGMATTYSYAWSGTNFVTTMAHGPASSLASGALTAGTRTVTTVNSAGMVIENDVLDIESGAVLDSGSATAFQTGTPFPSVYSRPLGTTEGYSYDGEGRVLSYTDRQGITTSCTYDALDRPVTVTRGGLTTNYAHNPGFLGVTGTTSDGVGAVRSFAQQTSPFGESQSLAISGPSSVTMR